MFNYFQNNIYFTYSDVMTYLSNFHKKKKISKNILTLNKAKNLSGENMLVSKNHI